MWTIFVFLAIYVYLSWSGRLEEKLKDLVRKCWYLFFILISLIYLTVDYHSVFDNWEKYLIALASFIAIDSLLFLNLYISKFLGNEMKWASDQVVVTQNIIDINRDKIGSMEVVLNTYSHIEESIDDLDLYTLELSDFLNAYAKREQLTIEVFSIRTESEKNELFNGSFPKRFRRNLDLEEHCYSSKDDLALIPLRILGEKYVAKVTSEGKDAKIESIDGQVINMLLVVYTLAVRVTIDSKGGSNDD